MQMLSAGSVVLVFLLLSAGCSRVSDERVQNLSEFDAGGYEGQQASADRIEELRADVATYSAVVDEKITAAGNLSSAYKLLGSEYQKHGMFLLALEAFQSALEIEPANTLLLYEAAVASGQWAASAPDSDTSDEYYELARRYYERAVGIDPFHQVSLYGLAVLLSFQFEEHAESESLIDRYLALRPDDTRAMFLKARLLALRGRTAEAAGLYGDIANRTTDEREKVPAIENQRELLRSE